MEEIKEIESQEPKKLSFLEYLGLSGYANNTVEVYMRYFGLLKRQGEPLDQEKVDLFCKKYRHSVARAFLRNYLYRFLKNKEIEVRTIRGRKQKRFPIWLTYDEVLLFAESIHAELFVARGH